MSQNLSSVRQINKLGMKFHVISYLIFCRKLGKMSQNLSSASDLNGALRVNLLHEKIIFSAHL